MSIRELSHYGMFARTRKAKSWWLMRQVLFALSAMLFLCPVIVRTGGGVNKNKLPTFTYTGTYTLIDDGDGNRRIKFLTSGTLVFAKNVTIDLFVVGGGGGGAGSQSGSAWCAGGGGGYTGTWSSIILQAGIGYPIVVGAGGSAGPYTGIAGTGGKSWAFNQDIYFANGGTGGSSYGSPRGTGGSGGSGGGSSADSSNGGSDGSNGQGPEGGAGQSTTTREFAEAAGTLYAGGGAGGYQFGYGGAGGGGNTGIAGSTNTGGGGGASAYNGTSKLGFAGGSGIVIVRNHLAA